MAVFDLGFLAHRARIFPLKEETVNFLLGKTQVDYFLSQCSTPSETENLTNSVICKFTLYASSRKPNH